MPSIALENRKMSSKMGDSVNKTENSEKKESVRTEKLSDHCDCQVNIPDRTAKRR